MDWRCPGRITLPTWMWSMYCILCHAAAGFSTEYHLLLTNLFILAIHIHIHTAVTRVKYYWTLSCISLNVHNNNGNDICGVVSVAHELPL